jgi:prophage regulatory protein
MLTLIRAPKVLQRRGCQKTYLYAEIRQGLFPPPVRMGSRFAAWPEAEVDAVLRARVAGASDASLRALVAELVDARKPNGAL